MKLKNETVTQIQDIDTFTGEIVNKVVTSSKTYSTKVQAEEFYITFINALSKIIGLNRMTDVRVLAMLCSKAEFNTGVVQLNSFVKQSIYSELSISYNSLANSLTSLKQKGFITIDKGRCAINPLLFWKGDLKTREDLLRSSGISLTINFSNTCEG